MSSLDHKIPPPLVTLACAAAMWWVARYTPTLDIAGSVRIGLAIALLAAGLFVILGGIVSFRRARTTVNPLKPETASALVTCGIYRYTRNPMYLGMLILLLAWAAYLASIPALAGAIVFWLYISRFQIRPEEAALRELFGSAFTDYANRVRRWL